MKDPFDRTKVVVRHLPPAISQSALLEQIDGRFSSRYKWFCFRPGKNSLKHQQHSRAYIDFKKPEDVVEFAEFFDGHIFVNEKGAQFKAIVEYAPSQRVPKSWSKKDGREGTIFKDPEYLEFLELIAKPIENLPSAEIQLERREAERAGQQKETLVVTPLMDFVRQKRAAKSGPQRVSTSGKLGRRAGGASSSGNSSSVSAKRGSEKRRISTSMYVLRDSPKNATGKEKSTYLLMSRREDKPVSTTAAETAEDEIAPVTEGSPSKVFGTVDVGDKKVLLLKGKERETFHVSDGISQQSVSSPVRNSPGSTILKQSQRREASGKIIRNILSKKEARPNQSATAAGPSEQQSQPSNLDKEKHPLRPTNVRSILKDRTFISPISSTTDSDTKTALHDKVVGDDSCGFVSVSDKQDRRTRNKDRPDRGVWTSLRPLDRSHPNDKFVSSFSQPTQLMSDSSEGIALGGTLKTEAELDTDNNNNFTGGKSRNLEAGVHLSRLGRSINSMSAHDLGDMKAELLGASKSGEFKSLGSGRNSISSVENGSHKHGGRRGSAHGLKEIDGSLNLSEGKPSKRGGGSGYGSHEKQVWVQKSGSGS